MKDAERIMAEHAAKNAPLVEHRWGMTPYAVFNELAESWARAPGAPVLVRTYKQYGAKALASFLRERGVECTVVGKGERNMRLLECRGTGAVELRRIARERFVAFEYRGRAYRADVGEAIFSKSGLDEATRMLLDAVFAHAPAAGARIGDLGAGWGAISLVLAAELPGARITAFERDAESHAAARRILAPFPGVDVLRADLTDEASAAPGSLDLAVTNPPFHSTLRERTAFFATAARLLVPGGELLLVVGRAFAPDFRQALSLAGFGPLSEDGDASFLVGRWAHGG